MKNVLEYLEQSESKYSNKIAVIEEEKTITYKELVAKSKRIASGLINNTSMRKPIPVLLEKGINALSAFFGAIYAGDFYVLLNQDLPVTRLKDIYETLDTNILITDKEHLELAKEISNDTILLIEDLENNEINEETLAEIRNKAIGLDPLYVNFTSGSTGKPKGVVIDNKSVIEFMDIFTDKFNINENDIIANQAPFDFDVSVKDIYSSIKVGATLVIVPKKLFTKPVEIRRDKPPVNLPVFCAYGIVNSFS